MISMIFVSSCANKESSNEGSTSEQKEKQASEIKAVMDIHDEVMPLMGKMIKYRKKAISRAELLLQDSLDSNDQEGMELENLAIELDAAAESMMQWMRSYNPDFDSLDHDEIMVYLKSEKEKINEVNTKIKSVMDKSKELLSEEE